MSRTKKVPSLVGRIEHPDGFPVVCCFGPTPVCIMDEAVARSFLKRIEEARQQIEKAIQIERQAKGGDA